MGRERSGNGLRRLGECVFGFVDLIAYSIANFAEGSSESGVAYATLLRSERPLSKCGGRWFESTP